MTVSESEKLIQELTARNLELTIRNHDLNSEKNKAVVASKKFEFFYNFSPNCCFIIDCNAKILQVNQSGSIFLGKPAEELIQLNFNQFIAKKNVLNFNSFLFDAKKSFGENLCEIELILKETQKSFVRLSCTFFEKEKQFLIIVIEKNKKEQLHIKFQQKELLFKKMLKIGQIGSYKFDMSTRFLELSKELYSLFGVAYQKHMSLESYFDLIDPEDRNLLKEYSKEPVGCNYLNKKKQKKVQ